MHINFYSTEISKKAFTRWNARHGDSNSSGVGWFFARGNDYNSHNLPLQARAQRVMIKRATSSRPLWFIARFALWEAENKKQTGNKEKTIFFFQWDRRGDNGRYPSRGADTLTRSPRYHPARLTPVINYRDGLAAANLCAVRRPFH